MEIQGCITIDLAKYGMMGEEIVLSPPTFRRQNELANVLGSYKVGDGMQPSFSEMGAGDLSMLRNLVYIKKAPFDTRLSNTDGFLEFCDALDAIRLGSAQELWMEVTEAVNSIESGDTHPLAKSE